MAHTFKAIVYSIRSYDLASVKANIGLLPTLDYQDPATNHMTLLHIAVLERATAIIVWLLENGADHTISDASGHCAAYYYKHRHGRIVTTDKYLESRFDRFGVAY